MSKLFNCPFDALEHAFDRIQLTGKSQCIYKAGKSKLRLKVTSNYSRLPTSLIVAEVNHRVMN